LGLFFGCLLLVVFGVWHSQCLAFFLDWSPDMYTVPNQEPVFEGNGVLKVWKRVVAGMALFTLLLPISLSAGAETLQGSVEQSDAMTRLQRPDAAMQGGVSGAGGAIPLRLGRPTAAPDFRNGSPLAGLVDTGAFTPLRGGASDDGGRLGLLKPTEFGTIPNNKFDLGAERGDRALVLAWETWHHQLSAAIYHRWGEMANTPGEATLRITVYRNGQIVPEFISRSGNAVFDRGLMAAINSLRGNPGLNFPIKSQRQQVTFEADYVAATDVKPGFSWVKNDYEKVNSGSY
jgi:hypothetical protein